MSTSQHAWLPDPQTGLSGDRYLTEEIAQHVDDLSDAHEPGVYTVELSLPNTSSYEFHVRLWIQEHDAIPDYVKSIASADRLLLSVPRRTSTTGFRST